ncbi:MAG: hypothetical protein JO000_25495 [Alphaproteobacteria bacterium]|nr:hypothetical protein [Alphaproteobacteria bacterium]
MSDERTAIYGPEELSLLGTIFDQAVASLPATMRTQANRTEIAKIVMDRAAAGERELLPLMTFAVAPAPDGGASRGRHNALITTIPPITSS